MNTSKFEQKSVDLPMNTSAVIHVFHEMQLVNSLSVEQEPIPLHQKFQAGKSMVVSLVYMDLVAYVRCPKDV
jgi:hypothetical protein